MRANPGFGKQDTLENHQQVLECAVEEENALAKLTNLLLTGITSLHTQVVQSDQV